MKISRVIYYISIAFVGVIVLLLVVSILPITGNIKFLTVHSGSMSPAIRPGSIVIIKPMEKYKIGDIITFNERTRTEQPTTHRIFDIKVVEGKAFYITKGDANNAPDPRETPEKNILGKVLFVLPLFGYAIDFVQKPLGFLLIIIIPALLIIGDEIKRIYEQTKKKKQKE